MVMPHDVARVYHGLWSLLAIQAICTSLLTVWIGVEFYHELVDARLGQQSEAHHAFQSHTFQLTVIAFLAMCLMSTIRVIHRLKGFSERKEELLRAATGDYFDLMQQYFDEWELTPSERDVALLSIKGLMIAEIAQLRKTKMGTIKAQCASIYRKAGVSGRPQLLSLFLDELIAMGISNGADNCPTTGKPSFRKSN
ncbi:MAG: hypothetical protein NXI27_12220 [Alphaproteobacteria bacterium]|nr:hypothetical protein [Alphaproteobacteria bacterium]